jgi:alkylated DNA repair dioxygenase AlkB
MMERKLIDKGGILDFDISFLPKEEADQLLDFLKQHVAWEQKFYTNYRTGEQYPQPRLTAWYADQTNMAYSYSGITQKVQVWLPELLTLKKKIEAISGADYNSVLLNFYRDGSDAVGFHADDEKELGQNANIASVSLGAARQFQLVGNGSDIRMDYTLTHGSLFIMSGTTQQYWKHSILKDKSIKEGRINLTFRKFHSTKTDKQV